MNLAIIGHARSGTTVLQNAINTSASAYVLGEANLYRGASDPDFRQRYNAMHRSYGNQVSKSTYAPALPGVEAAADGAAYLSALARHYRVVGDKLALGHPRFGHDLDAAKSWLESTRAHCLFVFRHPASVLSSSATMFGAQIPFAFHVASYALTIGFYLDTLRVLPNVRCLLHDKIAKRTFVDLGDWLDLDLSSAFELYDPPSAAQPPWPAEAQPYAADLETLYNGVAALAGARRIDPRLQLEQKISASGRRLPVGDLWRLAMAVVARAEQDAQPPEIAS